MKNDSIKKAFGKKGIYIKALIIEIVVTLFFVALFAMIMFLTENGYRYSALFATVSLAAGTLAAAYYAAKKIGSKGFLTGLVTAGFTFGVITLISLIVDDGGITLNTLFHFIIILLSGLIGGILGVNKGKNRKYI